MVRGKGAVMRRLAVSGLMSSPASAHIDSALRDNREQVSGERACRFLCKHVTAGTARCAPSRVRASHDAPILSSFGVCVLYQEPDERFEKCSLEPCLYNYIELDNAFCCYCTFAKVFVSALQAQSA